MRNLDELVRGLKLPIETVVHRHETDRIETFKPRSNAPSRDTDAPGLVPNPDAPRSNRR